MAHRQGVRHGKADALSRKPCCQCGIDDDALLVAATREQEQHLEVSDSAVMTEPVTLKDDQKRDIDLSIVRRRYSPRDDRPGGGWKTTM
jgi:hypothetical protein